MMTVVMVLCFSDQESMLILRRHHIFGIWTPMAPLVAMAMNLVENGIVTEDRGQFEYCKAHGGAHGIY